MKTIVLLSAYNGAAYLREQLESVLAQTAQDVEILARDDGSTDDTCKILEEYCAQNALSWSTGAHLGAARSFWELLRKAPEADYYAFCDQDDVWDPYKLDVAVRSLEAFESASPALYCSDVRVVNAALEPVSEHMVEAMQPSYLHALVKNIAPGCTFVFNRAAKELASLYDAETLGIELHDWTLYQIVSCFGRVVFDEKGHMAYRQHGGNAIGAAKGTRTELAGKARAFWSGPQKNSRERCARRLEQAFGSRMRLENRELTADFAHYRQDTRRKRRLLSCRELQLCRAYHALFRALVMFNRL